MIIVVKLLRRNTLSKSDAKPTKKVSTIFKQNLIIAAGLSLLFGLGWGFGLTATSSDVEELTFAFQILFSLFVGSQGVLIFVFHGLRSQQFRHVWVSFFGLRSTFSKSYALSSNLPPKKQACPSSIATYNMATLTATGTLPSDSSSTNQKKELLHSSDYSQGFSSVELDSEISYFEKATVIANKAGDQECKMDIGGNDESGTDLERNEERETKLEGDFKDETKMGENYKQEMGICKAEMEADHDHEMEDQECMKEMGGNSTEMDGNQECEEGNSETKMGENDGTEMKVNQKCETKKEETHAE